MKMDDLFLDKFQKLVTSEIEKLEIDLASLKKLLEPIPPDSSIGRLSRMEAIGERSVNQTNHDNCQGRLLRLRQAHQRIKDKTFGLCLICEENIAVKRLEVLPETLSCVACVKLNQNS